jgi:hypothetical protein
MLKIERYVPYSCSSLPNQRKQKRTIIRQGEEKHNQSNRRESNYMGRYITLKRFNPVPIDMHPFGSGLGTTLDGSFLPAAERGVQLRRRSDLNPDEQLVEVLVVDVGAIVAARA